MKEDAMMSEDAVGIFDGAYFFRLNGGEVVTTTVHIEISVNQILVRYGDGIDHVARHGDDAVDYFVSALAPSLRQPVGAGRRPDPEAPR
jgi:hypothetical protein